MGNVVSSRDVMLTGIDKSLYEIILDRSSDPIFCFAPDGTYLYINMAFSSAFKLMPSDIIGKRIWDVFPGKEGDMRFAAVKRALETKEEVILDVKVDAVDGTRYYMTTVTPIMDAEGIPRTAICISKEITLRKRTEQALKEAKLLAEQKNERLDMAVKELYIKSITDSLTKLYNRQHCIDLLEDAISKYESRNYDISIMLIDIDHYKNINDTYGHIIGDHALEELSSKLRYSFDILGTVGRYGGEEFIVILPNMSLQAASSAAESFRREVESSEFTDERIGFTISIGVAYYTGEGANDFLKRADDNMYRAKRQGRNMVVY